jgi:L-2-hydroxycarboxylate dehydrogenase (NAD+)
MLERFKVPIKEQVRVSEKSLRRTVTAFFGKMGESSEDAAIASDTLVTSDLRGVESHGVSNMLSHYRNGYENKKIKPRPNWRIVRETPGTANIDADNGLVVFLGRHAMQIAIDKAKKVGVGSVTVFNSEHSGAIGHHAMGAAQQDMIGMVMTSASARVVPTFASKALLGTNPIAVAAPARNEAPFLYDAATCSVAMNKIWIARRLGSMLGPGWICDNQGVPIEESILTPESDDEFLLLPLGGTREQGSHKGSGLAMIVDIMGPLLAGSLPDMLSNVDNVDRKQSHHFTAYNIEAFTELDTFKNNMDRMLQMIRETKPVSGEERVLYPGLIEYEEEQERRANGIPFHKEVMTWFEGLAEELSIPGLDTCEENIKSS